MDQFDEIYGEQIRALWRAMYGTGSIKDDNDPCQIEEGLYLGSLVAANNKSVLKRLNVTHILTVASSLVPAHPNDFKYKIVDVQDHPDINISQYFDTCFVFIDEAKETGGGVLVHCFAGRSRSVTIVLAYLMKKHSMRLYEALKHVMSKRPVASPNSGFLLQLQNFEKSEGLQQHHQDVANNNNKVPNDDDKEEEVFDNSQKTGDHSGKMEFFEEGSHWGPWEYFFVNQHHQDPGQEPLASMADGDGP